MSSPKQYNLQPFQNIPTQAAGATVTSSVTEIFNKDNVSLQFVWTGTLAGTFDVQVSDDYDANAKTGNWDSLPLSPAPVASGSPDSWLVDITQLGAKYIRVVFTKSGGAGNVTSTIMAKAV